MNDVDNIALRLEDAIGTTLAALFLVCMALAVLTYLEQRARVCSADKVFVLRLYSSELRRLWRTTWRALLCI